MSEKTPDILKINGYSICYEITRNRVTIGLPQTMRTFTNTVTPVSATRRVDLSETDLALMLTYVMNVFDGWKI